MLTLCYAAPDNSMISKLCFQNSTWQRLKRAKGCCAPWVRNVAQRVIKRSATSRTFMFAAMAPSAPCKGQSSSTVGTLVVSLITELQKVLLAQEFSRIKVRIKQGQDLFKGKK